MSDTILLIEDSADMRVYTSEILELAAYKVLTAKNGKEGLELAKKHNPGIILCDIMMPELDGYGVLRALENIPDMAGVPFVFITSKSEKKDFRNGMDLGADDYLVKPFTGDELLKVVNARLKKTELLKKTFKNNLEDLNKFINEANTVPGLNLLPERHTVKKLKKKEQLFMEGDQANFLYFVVSGKIKTFKTNQWGKEYLTALFKEGDFFGYTSLMGDNKHKDAGMAIENSEVAQIPKQDFYQLLYSNNELSLKFIKLLSNNLSDAEDRLLQLAYDSTRKRVAEALLFISKKYQPIEQGNQFFPVYRENISAIAGIAPESVSRNLSDFREEGLIETHNGTIKINDYKKLESLKN